jgi:hypothetical protein
MSAQKGPQILLIASLILLAIGLVALLAPQTVVAQCEDPKPSCCACHATAHPVGEQGEWHTIHARKECCRACHGGNDQTDDKDTAHAGMTLHPLDDTYLACHQCHPDDYQQRAKVFAVALHVTPQSSEPTARPAIAASTPPPMIVTPLPQATTDAAPTWGWPVALIVAALAIGFAAIWWRLSHRS